mmetsp:Transcript_119029/g.384342  ORF Transcript_119029/g.384342 Transcript_119029/m.384342 type:complete len:93 (+) Transcript_119029:395-673(+)
MKVWSPSTFHWSVYWHKGNPQRSAHIQVLKQLGDPPVLVPSAIVPSLAVRQVADAAVKLHAAASRGSQRPQAAKAILLQTAYRSSAVCGTCT